MQIEKLMPPARPGKPWLAALEDGSVLSVTEGEMIDFALYAGMELEEETVEKLKQAAVSAKLRNKVVSMLNAKAYATEELRYRLMQKGTTAEAAEDVVSWAQKIGLLNDEEYAKSVARHYSNGGYGVYKVRNELYRRRVPRGFWEDALAEMGDSAPAIDHYLARHLKSSDRKAVKKASDALARRGFTWEEIAEGIQRHLEHG